MQARARFSKFGPVKKKLDLGTPRGGNPEGNPGGNPKKKLR